MLWDKGLVKVIITTSRRPSPRTRSLVKDLVSVIPGGIRITRGHYTMEELGVLAKSRGADRLVVIGERRGNPSLMRIYEIVPGETPRNIVTIVIRGLSLSWERRVGRRTRSPKVLYVKPHDDLSDEFAEALMVGLKAKVLYQETLRGRESVIASIRKVSGDEALMEFFEADGKPIGPKLRMAKPRDMIKLPRDPY